MDAAAAGRLHRSQAAEDSEVPLGTVRCLPLGEILSGNLAAAVRLSVQSRSARPFQPLKIRQADQPAACSSPGRLSARSQRAAGNKAPREEWEPRPARRRPLPSPSRAGKPARLEAPTTRCPGLGAHIFWDQARAAVTRVWV